MTAHTIRFASNLTEQDVLYLQVDVMAGEPFTLPTVIIIVTRF